VPLKVLCPAQQWRIVCHVRSNQIIMRQLLAPHDEDRFDIPFEYK
jgi:hypothetical protein